MKWSCLIVITLALLGAALPVAAQDQASKFELYGGYYYTRVNVNASAVGGGPSETFNGNGGADSLNTMRRTTSDWWRIWPLWRNQYRKWRIGWRSVHLSLWAKSKLSASQNYSIRQALFGGIRTTNGIGESASENNFALTAGGGIDFKVSRQVSVRPVQAEYFMSKIPDGLNDRQNNLRLGAGVVFRLGRD